MTSVYGNLRVVATWPLKLQSSHNVSNRIVDTQIYVVLRT